MHSYSRYLSPPNNSVLEPPLLPQFFFFFFFFFRRGKNGNIYTAVHRGSRTSYRENDTFVYVTHKDQEVIGICTECSEEASLFC